MIVGYGDGYPSTHFGRFIGVGACVLGSFLTSLMIVSSSKFTTLDPFERKVNQNIFLSKYIKAYKTLAYLKNDGKEKQLASRVITKALKIHQMKRLKNQFNLQYAYQSYLEFNKVVKKFTFIKK
jgi:hypothetical protein